MHYIRCKALKCNSYANATGYCNRHRGEIVSCTVNNCTNASIASRPICYFHNAQRARFGLDDEHFVTLLNVDACQACGKKGVTLHIDHDHRCCPVRPYCGNCVRGMLCKSCNIALGFVGDSIDVLNGLKKYLQG